MESKRTCNLNHDMLAAAVVFVLSPVFGALLSLAFFSCSEGGFCLAL